MKVSIVTVVLNAEKTIRKTIESVITQDYEDIEYIIVDGQSNDKTLDIVNDYSEQVDSIISEPDDGLYDAMNKACGLVSGEIIYFLNADDYFIDKHVITEIAQVFADNDVNFVYGDVFLHGSNKRVSYGGINKAKLCLSTICHQAIFQKTSLFKDAGNFNTKYRIAADYDWIMRAYNQQLLKPSSIDRIICCIGTDGLSRNEGWEEEKKAILNKYYSASEIFFYRILPRKSWQLLKKILKPG